jgi:hypothetical protein
MYMHVHMYSRSHKNGDVLVPFHPVQTASAPLMLAVLFPFCMHACTISNWAWSPCKVKKMKGQLFHSPTRIDSFILPWSSKLFWSCSLLPLFFFEWVLRSRLESAIDDWSISSCQSTLITSKCDRLARAMLLLAFLGSLGVIFVLAMIEIVDCKFRRIGLRQSHSHCCVWEWPFHFVSTRRNGTKTSPIFLLLLYWHVQCMYTCTCSLDQYCVSWRDRIGIQWVLLHHYY